MRKRLALWIAVVLTAFLALSSLAIAQDPYPLEPLFSNVFVMNPSEDPGDVTVVVTYYDTDGVALGDLSATLGPLGSHNFKVDDATFLPDGFRGSAVISSDGPIVALAYPSSWTPSRSAYEGIEQGADEVLVPAVFQIPGRGRYDVTAIQNTSATEAEVQFTYFQETGTQAAQDTVTIPPQASIFLDTRDYVDDGFRGGLKVESLGDELIVATNLAKNLDESLAYDGFTPSEYGKEFYIPAARCKPLDSGQWSQTMVMNTEDAAGTVTVTYYSEAGDVVAQAARELPANTAIRFHSWQDADVYNQLVANAPDPSNPGWAKWAGPVKVESTVDVTVVELETLYGTEAGYSGAKPAIYAYKGLRPEQGADAFLLPSVHRKEVGGSAWDGMFSVIQMQNPLDVSVPVTVTLINQDGSTADEQTRTIDPNGKWNLNTAADLTAADLGGEDQWVGAAKVEADQPIMVVEISWLNGVAGAYGGFPLE